MAMLTSRTVSRLRPRVLSSSTTSALPLRCQTQIRTFRFGIWPSCFGHPYNRELRRRHRSLKRKYIDSFERKLWDDIEHSFSTEPRVVFKRAVARFWAPTDAKFGWRWPEQDELKSRKAASASSSYATWRSKIDEVINASPHRTPPDANTRNQTGSGFRAHHSGNGTESSHAQGTVQREPNPLPAQDYIIDPITNRRVPKEEYDTMGIDLEPPAQSFSVDEPPFMQSVPPDSHPTRQPVYSNGKAPTSELNKYGESDFDDWASPDDPSMTAPTKSSSSTTKAASRSPENSMLKDEYALNHLPLDDPVEDLDHAKEPLDTTPNKSVQKTPSGSKRQATSRTGSQISSHPASFNEPIEDPDQLQDELKGYQPYMHNENTRVRQSTQDLSDLEKYRYKAAAEPEVSAEPSVVYDDLHKYEPTTFEKIEARDKPIIYEDLHKYKPTTFEQVETRDQPAEHDDLHKYKPTAFEEVKMMDQPFEKYGDLEKYKEFRLQHLDPAEIPEQDTITESLKEYEVKEQDNEESNVANPCDLDLPRKIPKMNLPDEHVFSRHYSGQVEATSTRDSTSNSHEHNDGGGLMPTGVSADARTIDYQVATGLDQSKVNNNFGSSPSTNTRTDPLSISVRPINSPRLERALKRHLSALKRENLNSTLSADLYSKDPQGLETSFAKEHGGRHTMPLYRRNYGSEPGQVAPRSNHAADSEPKKTSEILSDLYYHRDPEIDGIPSTSTAPTRDHRGTQSDQPTIYKILAYDPTMETINVVETSSVVPDLALPMSPTEVLPRLSNPSKFFSYFGRLQAEGFEIVSGNGDTLIFRQVRPARGVTPGAAPVNPIDMMGRSTAVPKAAAFVSPTGFVNYDMPRVEEEPTEAARRPNVGAQDEPMPIGQASSSQKQGAKKKKKKMNVVGRVMVGGAWVAGISYALGVVGEYFITGGTDGKGPTGFSPL